VGVALRPFSSNQCGEREDTVSLRRRIEVQPVSTRLCYIAT